MTKASATPSAHRNSSDSQADSVERPVQDRRILAKASATDSIAATAIPLAALLLGLALALYPSLRSWMQQVPGDLGDTRFNLYLLEHSYQWLRGASRSEDFWSPAFFYPAAGVLAYSDTLLSVAPLYWPLRALGIDEYPALVLWYGLLHLLNFCSFLFLLMQFKQLRRPLWAHRLATASGAFLFAFSSSRLSHYSHPQLLTQFYSILALAFLLRGCRSTSGAHRSFVIAALCFSLQWYASFYLAWLLSYAALIALIIYLLFQTSRRTLLSGFRTHKTQLLGATAIVALCLAPLALQYLAASRDVGFRSTEEVSAFLPSLWALVYFGPAHSIYHQVPYLNPPAAFLHEHEYGIGFLSLALSIIGLGIFTPKKYRAGLYLTLIVLLLSTARIATSFSLWPSIASLLPAGGAIRAIGRIHLVLLIPWAVGLSAAIHFFCCAGNRGIRVLAVLLPFCIAIEQLREHDSFDWQSNNHVLAILQNAMESRASCASFFYASTGGRHEPWKYQLDVMWAGLQARQAVINGYSGNTPPGWNLSDSRIHGPEDRQRLFQALKSWQERHRLAADSVCWLISPASLSWAAPAASHPAPLAAFTLEEMEPYFPRKSKTAAIP